MNRGERGNGKAECLRGWRMREGMFPSGLLETESACFGKGLDKVITSANFSLNRSEQNIEVNT